MRRSPSIQPLLLLCLWLPAAVGAPVPGERAERMEERTVQSEAFLNAHPDMKYRNQGWAAHEAGDFPAAVNAFRQAAMFGDKASQALLAELFWQGKGVPQDRARAYVWSDLAAERGYPQLLAVREHYWAGLDEAERERALAIGRELYAEYGDDVALPRLAKHLMRARRSMAGGRPNRGADVHVRDAGGRWVRIPGHYFYSATLWEPARYQQWEDEKWMPPREGRVQVGDPVPVARPSEQQP